MRKWKNKLWISKTVSHYLLHYPRKCMRSCIKGWWTEDGFIYLGGKHLTSVKWNEGRRIGRYVLWNVWDKYLWDFKYFMTNSMEQSSWEANSHSATQEISQLSWNPKVHYHVHKSLTLIPILTQMNSPHSPTLFLQV